MAENEQTTRRVLVVDDLPENARLLKGFLQPMGFSVDAARCGEEALAIIEATPPDVILLDLMMPGMDGFEVCRRIKRSERNRHIPVIIITGLNDREANIRAIEAGADDFLIKPFDKVLLGARVKTSFQAKKLHDSLLEYQHELEDRVRERTREVERTREITVLSLARLAESRDNETGEHLERMRRYARLLAEEMASWDRYPELRDPVFLENIYQTSPLHDIGKVGIPDGILLKPGPLSEQEYAAMKAHTIIGGDTLRDTDLDKGAHSFLAMGRDIAYYHHEHWDGKGYPYGLAGEQIPLAARIVALADVYDALSSQRHYKKAFSHGESREIILAARGAHFDPSVVDAFLKCEPKFEEIRLNFQNPVPDDGMRDDLPA